MAWIIVYSKHPKIRSVKANLNDSSLLVERTKRDHIRLRAPNIEILEKKLNTNCLVPYNRISTSVPSKLRLSICNYLSYLISYTSRLQLNNRQIGLGSPIFIQIGVIFCSGGSIDGCSIYLLQLSRH